MAKELDEATLAAIEAEVKRQLDAKFPRGGARRSKPVERSEGEDVATFPEGKVVGKCPECHEGVVQSQHTKPKADSGKKPRVVFKCSNNDYRDKDSCQFTHWGTLAELEEKLPKEAVNNAPRAKVAADEKPDRARLAQSINQRLNKMDKTEVEAILSAFGKPDGKLPVAWVFAQSTPLEVLQEVDKALE